MIYVAIFFLFLLACAVAVAAGMTIGNLVGWYFSYGREGEPFNWRVFAGPNAYLDWLRK